MKLGVDKSGTNNSLWGPDLTRGSPNCQLPRTPSKLWVPRSRSPPGMVCPLPRTQTAVCKPKSAAVCGFCRSDHASRPLARDDHDAVP